MKNSLLFDYSETDGTYSLMFMDKIHVDVINKALKNTQKYLFGVMKDAEKNGAISNELAKEYMAVVQLIENIEK